MHELQRLYLAGPDPSRESIIPLFFDKVAELELPAIEAAGIYKSMDSLVAYNKQLGNIIHGDLKRERARLSSFRRILREKPAGEFLSKPPSGSQAASNRSQIWQAVHPVHWCPFWPFTKKRLLDRMTDLSLTLEKGRTARLRWIGKIAAAGLMKLEVVKRISCRAHSTLNEIKWELEAEMERPLSSSSGDKDLVLLGDSKVVALQELAGDLVVVKGAQANLGHMCQLSDTGLESIVDIRAKLTSDLVWYRRTRRGLHSTWANLGDNTLTDSAKVLSFERYMDDIANSMLQGMQYWEE